MNSLGAIGFPGESIIDFSISGNHTAVLTSGPHAYVYDENLALQSDFTLPEGHHFSLIALAPDGVVLAGTERFGSLGPGKGNNAAFLKKYDFDGNTVITNRDAGVTGFRLEQEPVLAYSGKYQLTLPALKARVQNFSDSTLQRVNLNVKFPGINTNCGWKHQGFSQRFDSLGLLPGEAMELTWEGVQASFAEDPSGSWELCIWTSMPDQKLDVDPSNDLYCINIDIPVDVEEVSPFSDYAFRIYPNPAASGSTIETRLPFGTEGEIRIFNSLGQQLEAIPVKDGASNFFSGSFPPGLYYISLAVEGRVIQVEKFVKW
ncbi:MAG: T9SS type A sorting domain-containing protein [Lewinellaceae bacterium]|nr:T9SS type A sorting domain-containing protein [Lewinellaceae bacterium]